MKSLTHRPSTPARGSKPLASPPAARRATPAAARVDPHAERCSCGGTCPRCRAAALAAQQGTRR